MTASGQRTSAEKVAASNPTLGTGAALKSLPKGWGSFQSQGNGADSPATWYATAPWDAEALRDQFGEAAKELANTVSADSKTRLLLEVGAQMALYASLKQGAE